MAQEPPAELPPLFQERFCLSDRHVRCEWYKDAQSSRAAALEQEGIGAEQVRSARFRPSVRSLPLALGPSDGSDQAAGRGAPPRRLLLIALAVVGGFIVLVLIALLLGSGEDSGAGIADGSPAASAMATESPPVAATPRSTTTPAAEPTTSTTGDPTTTGEPTAPDILIRYEVQEGEKLRAIADHFGISRRRIIRANEGMADAVRQVEDGQVIRVPVPAEMPREEITSLLGFVRFVEDTDA
jgi:LysM repeat protein